MKRNEFRIGNYLQDRDGRFCTVESISTDNGIYAPAIHGSRTSLPNKPIPITGELLLKIGLKKHGDDFYTSDLILMLKP